MPAKIAQSDDLPAPLGSPPRSGIKTAPVKKLKQKKHGFTKEMIRFLLQINYQGCNAYGFTAASIKDAIMELFSECESE